VQKLRQDEWVEWLAHPATLALKRAVATRIEEIAEQILGNRDDPSYDTFLKGMVRAYREFLEAKPDMMDDEILEKGETDEV
jgi:hypothetical protein